jgi:alpha-galactosidase
VWALAPGTGEWCGEAWGLHLAWSGNHALHVEVLPDGRRVAHLAELLLPGEVCVDPGATHEAPEVVGAYSGGGLTPASWAYHRLVRARPHHPGASRPRPVVCNTWEATYFDHDAARLRALADAAAAVGAERFVLDDGWFGGRRHDRAGLGDWVVSREAHPEGLAPLISHVRSLGMDFGIWVEPEMVNPDSDLHRAHPDWVLADPRYEPVLARHQLVLDLARPEAYAHVRDRLHALLAGHEIAFVKWDMNRDHVHATGARGAAGTRSQTLAVYRLLDELRAAHPRVEFESCASGGGRVDLEILRRTERVWASDCIDPLERQHVQRGTSMLLPPEVIGSHVGADRSHTTGRRHDLAFRVATAMFGHLGLELDLAVLDAGERSRLAEGVALYRRHRALVHGGDAVRFDPPGDADPSGDDPELLAHGVYSVDRSEALVCLARLRTGRSLTPPPLRLPGLDPARRYRVARVALPGERADRPTGSARHDPAWLAPGAAPLEMTGEALATLGVQPPALWPEQAFVVHLVAVRS